eukprot:scaffold53945_cov75-Phaeocystis_antarctica.AAC.4
MASLINYPTPGRRSGASRCCVLRTVTRGCKECGGTAASTCTVDTRQCTPCKECSIPCEDHARNRGLSGVPTGVPHEADSKAKVLVLYRWLNAALFGLPQPLEQ